mmetsp:Transcript_20373/g.44245  ORF Transcript_20373/g.44245 Transcript_20373/m.44245 type:complete len:322 (+) Transcript_20373:2645-3610(+)
MLDLHPRIDFHKEMISFLIHQEFHRPSISVFVQCQHTACILENLLPSFTRQTCSGSRLNNLLMTTLHGAITVVEMDDVTRTVSQALHFDMTWLIDIFLNEAPSIPKSVQSLVTRQPEHALHILRRGHDSDATTTSSHGSLDNHWVRDGIGRVADPSLGLGWCRKGSVGSSDGGYIGFDGQLFGRGLVSKCVEIIHSRTHKFDARLLQLLGKAGILAQESIPGMNRLHTILDRQFDDCVNVQICGDGRLVVAELESLVGLVTMLGEAIFVRVNPNSAASQLAPRPHDTRRNLPPIGSHELVEWRRLRLVLFLGGRGEASRCC